MRVLVTGVSGFVGGHLAEHLLAAGDEVAGLSASGRWPAALAHLAARVPLERGDLTAVAASELAESVRRRGPRWSITWPRRRTRTGR